MIRIKIKYKLKDTVVNRIKFSDDDRVLKKPVEHTN